MLRRSNIGIVGSGVVGSAHARGFAEYAHSIRRYDLDPMRRDVASLKDLETCDIIFVCLPTPAIPETGECDTSIVRSTIQQMVSETGIFDPASGYNPAVVIKSTLPPGTTNEIQSRILDLGGMPSLLHSPEFLTARCASIDFNNPSRHIIGIPPCNLDIVKDARPAVRYRVLLEERFPGVPVEVMNSDESEMVKLFANAFFAMKVGFFNEMYAMCEALGCRFKNVRRGVLLDGRITHSHSTVPGPDGSLGFGGMCFPKDLNDLIHSMRAAGVPPRLFESLWQRNLELRKMSGDAPAAPAIGPPAGPATTAAPRAAQSP